MLTCTSFRQANENPMPFHTAAMPCVFHSVDTGGEFLGLCDKKSSYKRVRFWTVMELREFFNSRTRPGEKPRLTDQLAGDVLNLMAHHLRCKHDFCQLTSTVHNRAAACFAASGDIFENEL
jgi:hypothetical protein